MKIDPQWDDDKGETVWKINLPFAVEFDRLEDIAEDIESGDILPGAFVLALHPEDYDQLAPDLVRRLGAFIKRGRPDAT